jgi:hypothetical protein
MPSAAAVADLLEHHALRLAAEAAVGGLLEQAVAVLIAQLRGDLADVLAAVAVAGKATGGVHLVGPGRRRRQRLSGGRAQPRSSGSAPHRGAEHAHLAAAVVE